MSISNPSDTERLLLDRLRAGDKTAFREVYDQHYPMLLSTVRRFVPDHDICRELAQEVMVRFWLRHADLQIQSNLGGYLRRMAMNASIDHLEAEKRRRIVPVTELLHASVDPHEELEQNRRAKSLEMLLEHSIDQLPEKCRLVFTMSRFEKMPYRDIAERLGVSQKAVEKHISKALDTLRRVVQEHEYSASFWIALASMWL